jgi:hypothetical protein
MSETSAIRMLKQDMCDSLSGRERIIYDVGIDSQNVLCLQISGYSGQGRYNHCWTPYGDIEPLLKEKATFSSEALKPLFKGRSGNSAGFLMAALKHLGVIVMAESGAPYRFNKPLSTETLQLENESSELVNVTPLKNSKKTSAKK